MFARHLLRRSGFVPVVAGLLLVVASAGPTFGVSGWTGPDQIGTVDGCGEVSLAHNVAGARHIVADCGTSVRYLTDATGEWVTTTFSHPANRLDLGPKIAIDGDTIHVAYTRFMPENGAYVSIGVYQRERALDGDTWSTTVRLGNSGDTLDSFTVIDGVVHAVIASRTGDIYYETDVSGALRRYLLPGATGSAAVHVESDHAARFVYETDGLLRYAVFHGSGFDWSSIPGADADADDPQLVLDRDNKAHVTWTHVRLPDEAAGPAGADGVFYATNMTGEWTPVASRRVTAYTGPSALDLDLDTGRPHVLVATNVGLKYYAPASGKAWGGLTLTPRIASDLDVSFDQDTGQVVVAYVRLETEFNTDGLYLMTKP